MKPTNDLIAEARELAERATRGPWTSPFNEARMADPNDHCNSINRKDADEEIIGVFQYDEGYLAINEQNAAFIARSRTLVPELCDALEKACAEAERLKDTNKALESDNYNAEMNLSHMAEVERLKAAQRWMPVKEDG